VGRLLGVGVAWGGGSAWCGGRAARARDAVEGGRVREKVRRAREKVR
jgi:hypothetical protein